MKQLICNISLFELHQRIYLVSSEETSTGMGNSVAISSIDSLGESLSAMTYKYNVDNIHLYGNTEYITKIIQDFDKHSNLAYSNNKVKIEVN